MMKIYIFVALCLLCPAFAQNLAVAEAFVDANIVPDLIPAPPGNMLNVYYPTAEICLGVEVAQTQVIAPPTFEYPINPARNYTLMFVDIDVPSAEYPSLSPELYLLTVNIPSNNITAGFTVVPYVAPRAVPGSGSHRYVFLLYRQTRAIDITNRALLSLAGQRFRYNLPGIVSQYNLELEAGNFFTINIPPFAGDDYCNVEKLRK